MSKPYDHPEIRGFMTWARGSRRFSMLNKETDQRLAFNPPKQIKSYLEENDQKLRSILQALFDPQPPPIAPESILQDYTAVFCILLHLEKASLIQDFVQYGSLGDHNLPFDPAKKPSDFPDDTPDSELYDKFCKHQWRFCAPTFTFRMWKKRFEDNRILPFVYKEKIAVGGSAILYRIELDDFHNNLIPDQLRSTLSKKAMSTFVIKSYLSNDAELHYNTEISAFQLLPPCPNIIGYYGSYIQNNEYNIILEHADRGCLENYFMDVEAPRKGVDIMKFWENMFQLESALMKIHEVKPHSQGASNAPIFQGMHQDVKPENILVVSNNASSQFDSKFKLGDLGLSHFRRKGESQNDPSTDNFGTRTYGAPECYRADVLLMDSQLPVSPKADIWSLGCIYSEAARWIAHGKDGLVEYRNERLIETERDPDFRDGNCFHNGHQRLQAVDESHKLLLRSLSGDDFITAKVVDLIDEMLEPGEGARPTALQLHSKSSKMMKKAREEFVCLSSPKNPAAGGIKPSLPPVLPNGPPPARLHLLQRPLQAADQPMDVPMRLRVPSNAGSFLSDDDQSHSPEDLSAEEAYPNTRTLRSDSQRKRTRQTDPLPEQKMRPTKAQSTSDGKIDYRKRRNSGDANYYNDREDGPWAEQNSEEHSSGPRGMLRHVSMGAQHGRNRPLEPVISPTSTNKIQRGHTVHEIEHLGRREPYSSSGLTASPQHPRLGPRSPPSSPLYAVAESEDLFTSSSGLALEHVSNSRPAQSYPKGRPDIGAVDQQSYDEAPITTRVTPPTPFARPPKRKPTDDEIPAWSIQQALDWKSKRQRTKSYVRPPSGADLLDRLYGRDQVFLLDNGVNMRDYWPDVKKVFEALAYIVKDPKIDKDGVEMFFSNSGTYQKSKTTSILLDVLDREALTGKTDIEVRLNKILGPYKTKLEKKRTSKPSSIFNLFQSELRPLSLYVLTNGSWESQCTGEAPIRSITRLLDRHGFPKGQVGIQFISFGADRESLDRLEKLDSGLGEPLDIVDTTPWTGKVWKMLLGAINDTYDGDMNRRSHIPASTYAISPPPTATSAKDEDYGL